MSGYFFAKFFAYHLASSFDSPTSVLPSVSWRTTENVTAQCFEGACAGQAATRTAIAHASLKFIEPPFPAASRPPHPSPPLGANHRASDPRAYDALRFRAARTSPLSVERLASGSLSATLLRNA